MGLGISLVNPGLCEVAELAERVVFITTKLLVAIITRHFSAIRQIEFYYLLVSCYFHGVVRL